jgi:hypothetical protein
MATGHQRIVPCILVDGRGGLIRTAGARGRTFILPSPAGPRVQRKWPNHACS